MNKRKKSFSKENKSFLRNLTESNTLIFFGSLFISFLVWVAVAMYASPEESYTIYNVPINVNTENTLVSQNEYKNFWQSDDKIDVVVTGPRYMVTSMTAEDLSVTVNLNNVDSAGVSEVPLKVSLKSAGQDVTISSYSKKSISVYFDAELEKSFDIHVDTDYIAENIAESYQLNSANLTIPKITLKGPATEMKKIVDVVARPIISGEKLFETQTLPVDINLDGENAADTVSINRYIEIVDAQNNNVKIKIDKLVSLKPVVSFDGTKEGEVSYSVNTPSVIAKVDTEYSYSSEEIVIKTINYSELSAGKQIISVKASEIDMPDGVSFADQTFTFNIEVEYTVDDAVPAKLPTGHLLMQETE